MKILLAALILFSFFGCGDKTAIRRIPVTTIHLADWLDIGDFRVMGGDETLYHIHKPYFMHQGTIYLEAKRAAMEMVTDQEIDGKSLDSVLKHLSSVPDAIEVGEIKPNAPPRGLCSQYSLTIPSMAVTEPRFVDESVCKTGKIITRDSWPALRGLIQWVVVIFEKASEIILGVFGG